MKLVRYRGKENLMPSYGVVWGKRVVDLPKALEKIGCQAPVSMEDLLTREEEALSLLNQVREKVENFPFWLQDTSFLWEQVRLLSPLNKPGKIICIGLNYAAHAQEGGRSLPEEPVLFGKFANALVGPGEPVRLPHISNQVDYEAELAVVIGKIAYRVEEDEALKYVFGYANFNDISARDLQRKDGQWMKGKFLDTFAPFGPYLVTRDEIPDPGKLDICLRLNGKTMQSSNTSDLIFNVPYLVSFLSQFVTLEPGDIIATGTPSGVGFARKPPVFLQPGDIMEVEITGLGILENPVV